MNQTNTTQTMMMPAWTAVWRSRLFLALWVSVAVAFLAIFVTDLWVSYPLLAAPCAGAACHYQAITEAEAAVLAAWGLPVNAYALYILGISVLPVILFTALAVLTLNRLYPQKEGMFYALTLIVIPVVAITSFDVVAAAFPRLTIPIQLTVVVGQLLLMSLFLVFPRSRFEPRWTAVIPAFSAFFGLYPLFFAESFSFPIAQPYFLLLILVAAIIVYRYRRLFNESERLQTKWAILGILIFFVGVPIWAYTFEMATPAPGQAQLFTTLGGWTLCMITTMALPTAIFIAILRNGLWDIDLILNRTLVYGGLTMLVISIYALTVGLLSLLFHTSGSLIISLVATGLIAVLFQPLHQRLQRGVNRLMFGERDDPTAVLTRLGQRLEAVSQPDAVLPAIVETVTHALKLPYAAIVLADETVAAETGRRPDAPLHPFFLVYQSEMVGQLQVAARSPGEGLSVADDRVLRQVALQAGTAVHTIRLAHDLQHSRIRLVTTREEERRRLRRDLHDELGPVIASQGLKLAAARELLHTDPDTAVRLLDDVLIKNQNTVAEVRRLVYNLRPPTLDELGLVGAIREYVQSSGQTGLKVTITAPDNLPPLSAAVEAAAYRIVAEAFTNVLRHAAAHHCVIVLHVETAVPTLVLHIQDDGKGLKGNGRTGIGLLSMRERAEEVGGVCEIVSGKKGVRVTAVLPIGEETP